VVAAIYMLRGHDAASRERLLPSIGYAVLSALAFAVTDILVQRGAPHGGFALFGPVMFGLMGLYSFGFMPFFHEPLWAIPRATWRWLLPGAVLLALNAMGMAYSISTYGHATPINIVYSSRGLWSVALVWVFGHWFANTERAVGPVVMRRRLAGAGLLVLAIVLVLV
jgi:hypothetical protein